MASFMQEKKYLLWRSERWPRTVRWSKHLGQRVGLNAEGVRGEGKRLTVLPSVKSQRLCQAGAS